MITVLVGVHFIVGKDAIWTGEMTSSDQVIHLITHNRTGIRLRDNGIQENIDITASKRS